MLCTVCFLTKQGWDVAGELKGQGEKDLFETEDSWYVVFDDAYESINSLLRLLHKET